MRAAAREAETVAGFEHEQIAVDPQFKAAADDDPSFLPVMRIGALAGSCAGGKSARQKLERAVERRTQELVDNPGRKVEPAPARPPHDDVALGLGGCSGLEKPTDRNAKGTADRVQRIDRRSGEIALEQAEVSDRQPGRLRYLSERVPARFPQAPDLAAEEAHTLAAFRLRLARRPRLCPTRCRAEAIPARKHAGGSVFH